MKVYTKTGDKGITSLYGGKKVSKANVQIEAYGTVDELNSFAGLLHDKITGVMDTNLLGSVQNELFVIGSHLANDGQKSKIKLPQFSNESTLELEREIDKMELELPAMTHFVLPRGHEFISLCHVARTVCRRAERAVVNLDDEQGQYNSIVMYLNRLSDYFFVLARYLTKVLKVEEVKWIPSK